MAEAPAPAASRDPSGLAAIELRLDSLHPGALLRAGAGFVLDGGALLGGERVVALGEAASVEASGATRFAEVARRCQRIAAGIGGPASGAARFVGGATFSTGGPARFVLPRWLLLDGECGPRAVRFAPAAQGDLPAARHELAALLESRGPTGPSTLPRGLVRDDGADAFVTRVERAIEAIERGVAEKIVVGRTVDVELEDEVDLRAVWARLREGEPEAIGLALRTAEGVVVAASPERLVVRRGDEALADALAGTARRASPAAADALARAALLASDKDGREHELVASAVEAELRRAGGRTWRGERGLRTLRVVHHLATEVRARFAGGAPHVAHLAGALHPTPAVAGTPTEAALRFLAEREPDRGWFTGVAGWFDARGDGAFAVILRAASLKGRGARLFAGTGIVRGSTPASELAETSAKLAAARRALGLEEAETCAAPGRLREVRR